MSFLGVFFVASPKAQAQVSNPTLSSSCGIDIVLIMDSSSSMYGNGPEDPESPLNKEKDAFENFVDAFLPNTPTQMAIVDFSTTGSVLQDYTNNVNDLKMAIRSASTTPNEKLPNGDLHPDYVGKPRQYTNWHDALVKAHSLEGRIDKPKLYVFASDGNPNRYGNPAVLPPQSIQSISLSHAVIMADAIKQDGVRIISLGFGKEGVDFPENFQANFEAISGTKVAPPNNVDESADVILTNFTDLANALSNLADNLCAGTVTVRKYLDNVPDDDWTFYASTTTGQINQTSGQTADGGYVVFEINNLDSETAEVNISEDLPNGYSLESAYCEGGLGIWAGLEISGIPVGKNDSIYCEFYNIETPLPATSSISGFKFEDENGEASTTADQIPGVGWVINLFDIGESTTTPLAATTTNSSGYFEFNNLVDGTYKLTEILKSGWTPIITPTADIIINGYDSENNDFVNYYEKETECANGETRPCQYTGPDGTENVGICHAGEQTCANGSWGQCDGEVTPENEICGNGIDEDCNGSDASCGGGGGGSVPQGLIISNEQAQADCDSATITWLTNKFAASRVVYDNVSHSDISGETKPNYGYAFSSDENSNMVTGHSVEIAGLNSNTTYYFRPISDYNSIEKTGKEIEIALPVCAGGGIIVLGEEGAPVLTIAKTVNKTKVNPGEKDIEFSITVKNEGSLTAFNVKLNDILPPGISFQDFDGNTKNWDLGDIAPGEETAVKYMAMAGTNASAKTYANNASASADNHESVTDSASLEVEKVIVLAETGFKFNEFIILFIYLLTLLGAARFIRSRRNV